MFRICQLKDTIGTWDEVAEILNRELGLSHTESKYRRDYSTFIKMLDAVKDQFFQDEQLGSMSTQLEQLQKERHKLQATKLSVERSLRQESRFELFYENVRDAIVALEPPVLDAGVGSVCDSSPSNIRVLGIADIHYGATFKSLNNTYSREECKRRFSVLLSSVKNTVVREGIRKLKIVNAADDIQGILRMSDLQINDIPIVDCVVEISRLLAGFLNQLSAICEIEYYHCSSANHSQIRPLGSKASELASEDMERIIVSYISDLLAKNDRVEVISGVGQEHIPFEIYGFKAAAMHGHQIKSVDNAVRDLQQLHRVLYDYVFLGHNHSANEIIVGEGPHHNVEVISIPAFIGSDPYADKLMVGGKAMAKLYEFDPVYGHVGSKNIILN